MKLIFSRNFFYFLTFSAIIFLTGCARGGYHSVVRPSAVGPTATTRWPLSSTTQHFVWPLKGRVLLPFGSKEDHVSLKGIVIQAKPGDRVVASRDGRVKLIDQKLKGYGKTIILEHPGEFYTVYARNSEISVTLGQWVRQGQPIAQVGPRGREKLTTLYFEIRKSAKVEDPLRYLRS